jgi:hypothetical protein
VSEANKREGSFLPLGGPIFSVLSSKFFQGFFSDGTQMRVVLRKGNFDIAAVGHPDRNDEPALHFHPGFSGREHFDEQPALQLWPVC